MSIANQITALGQDKTAIAAAISAKGVNVPSGRGFDDFAADISNIHDLKVANFTVFPEKDATDQFIVPTIYDHLDFELDFEPKAFFFKCNDMAQNVYDALADVTGRTYADALFSGYCVYSGFTEEIANNTPSMIWVERTSSSTGLSYVTQNRANLLSATFNSQTQKWDVELQVPDTATSNRFFRFILATANATTVATLQVFFIG